MNKTRLTLGFSPCPNDTFIFDALVNKKIDTGDIEFEYIIEDVEHLNNLAFKESIDVTKISYYSFAQLLGKYEMMRSGGALGRNCGPLLVAAESINWSDPSNLKVAIPGHNTTANVLLKLAYPNLIQKEAILFSEIENKVLDGTYDLGLIIHESRFTYESKGLQKVADLGEFWEQTTKSPIPLGGICIHSKFDTNLKQKVEQLISESVEYAFKHPQDTMSYVKSYAQEMDETVMKAHINLYVNEYSVMLGDYGERGVHKFIDHLNQKGLIRYSAEKVFV